MSSLEPGQRVETPPSERLRVQLGGPGAKATVVAAEGDGAVSCRTKEGGTAGSDVLVEATRPGTATLVINSATPGSPILGRVTMQVLAAPSTDVQPRPKKREWVVNGLQLEGRTSLSVLKVSVDERKVWAIESLLVEDKPKDPTPPRDQRFAGNPPPPADAASRARITWGDRNRVTVSLSVIVDRSASMAWAFQADSALECVRGGVQAAATAASSGSASVGWFSFGSAAERKSERIRRARVEEADDVVLALKPDLFSSGSRLDVDLLEQLKVEQAIVVTDSCAAGPELLAGHESGTVSSLIVVGAAGDDELITAEDQDALRALAGAGIGVLLLPVEATAAGDDADRWIDLVSDFVLGRIAAQSAHESEDARAAEE